MKRVILATTTTLMLGISGTATAYSALNDFEEDNLESARRSSAILGGEAVGTDGNRTGSVHEMTIGENELVQSVDFTRRPDDSEDPQYLVAEWTDVDLAPDEGEVEDVLITAKANDMAELVIESAQRAENNYALPHNPEYADYEKSELDLPDSANTLKDLPDLAY